MKGHLLEMFRSFQGEGPYAGVRQVFVRFSGCHLRCRYCDTPESWERSKSWSLEGVTRTNPVDVGEAAAILRDWSARERFHSVSFTGGEPLLQPEFLRALALEVRRLGLPTYLDTSGTLSDRLARVADVVDIFALDIKLPSTPGVRAEWDDIRRCLEIAGRKAFVKIVTTADSRADEIERALETVAEAGREIPVVLQPATGFAAPSASILSQARAAAARRGLDLHVLPQLHVLAGWK